MAGKEDNIKVIKDIVASDLNESTKNEAVKKFVNDSGGDEMGTLDKFFGKSNPEMYLIVLLCIMLLAIGLINTFVPETNAAKEYWNLVVPAFTLAMGYLVGKNKE